MGFIEVALERTSISSIASFLAFMTLLWVVASYVDEYLRLRRFPGAQPKTMPGSYFFGTPSPYSRHAVLNFFPNFFCLPFPVSLR